MPRLGGSTSRALLFTVAAVVTFSSAYAAVTAADSYQVVRGLNVEITLGGETHTITHVQSVTGLTCGIEVGDTSIGGDKFVTTAPGHKFCSPVTLVGPLLETGSPYDRWIKDTLKGANYKATVTIRPIGGSDQGSVPLVGVTFLDAFPIAYSIGSAGDVSRAHSEGNQMESLTFLPNRVEYS